MTSSGHRIEFQKSIAVLAVEATKAARADHVQWIQPEHIEIAIDELRAWDFWPFKGG